ncbi:hypothetical protein HAU32_10255 [Weissella confusa]|uniref:Uncharacterized protein n=1 Tax=Weissella fermenti TaxID=2987699 RepID=A0ABT6D8M7_9LACO|nr:MULTISPECIES: hypothetical protein [Weissella]MBJ7689326.1 hypothetical protein [Weissella confusa]MDF9301008.1 hypothetical protein [Weissella sp. BK2]
MYYLFISNLIMRISVDGEEKYTLKFENAPFATTGGEVNNVEDVLLSALFGLADMSLYEKFINEPVLVNGDPLSDADIVPFIFVFQMNINKFKYEDNKIDMLATGETVGQDNYEFHMRGTVLLTENVDIAEAAKKGTTEKFELKLIGEQ